MLTFILCVLFFGLGSFLAVCVLGLGITVMAKDGDLVIAGKLKSGTWIVPKSAEKNLSEFVSAYLDDKVKVVKK